MTKHHHRGGERGPTQRGAAAEMERIINLIASTDDICPSDMSCKGRTCQECWREYLEPPQ